MKLAISHPVILLLFLALSAYAQDPRQDLNRHLDVVALAAGAVERGKADRGVALFASARTACLTCHKIGAQGGLVGPDLTRIGTQRTAEQIAESLLFPNRQVEEKYKVLQVLSVEGHVFRGYRVRESTDEIVLSDPSTQKEMLIERENIEQMQSAPSVMPEGLAASMTREQQMDLIAFLADLGHHRQLRSEIAQSVLEHAQPHEPAGFAIERRPINVQLHPNWQSHVNRDRLYDFYRKQANAFRGQSKFEPLLSEFPGLDGGQHGHWGNQQESTWESDEWNHTTLGSVQAGVFFSQDMVVPRAICLQLGDQNHDGQTKRDQLFACFDPDTLSYRALWKGRFISFSNVRHGFIAGLRPGGDLLPLPADAQSAVKNIQPNEITKYHGYYRVGSRVVFAYRIGDTEYLDTAWVENGQFVRQRLPRHKHSMAEKLRGDSAQWPETMITNVRIGSQTPYAIDTIDLPVDNPWKAPIYCGDHDFFPDGSALVCTMQGDVWHVSGFSAGSIDAGLPQKATWRRFAAGLHQALGIKIDRDGIFVLGRDQLTRLHDTNDDGEADFYECYSRAFETSSGGHDYICGLQRDREGNFFTASGNQGLLRISSNGQRADIIAAGFRNPDGLGIYPDGVVTVPCSEGEWTPSSMICAVTPPGSQPTVEATREANLDGIRFFGYRGTQYVKRPIARPELPMVYLPRGLDNSAGGQVFVDSQRWGPLAGLMVHFSFGTGSHFLLLRDQVGDQLQGAVVPLEGQFDSGTHRGRFSPHDGQLYVSGMAGWGAYTSEPGCFQRVRYTGAPVVMPIGFHLHENGIAIRFSEKLDRSISEQPREHFAQAWNYRYGPAYGSAEYSAAHYGMRGHDQLRIAAARVLNDDRTLFLDLPDLERCNQLHLQVASGPNRRHDIFATCNALDAPLTVGPSNEARLITHPKQLAAPPLDRDMLLATKVVLNPWRKAIKNARTIRIEAGKNLTFSTREIEVQKGEAIALTLANPDVVPHNWALLKPGKLKIVGEEANKLVADPEAIVRQYVPQTADVICYTDIVDPKSDTTIYFKAPTEPGRYPFLCSFPGHWMVMNGELIIK